MATEKKMSLTTKVLIGMGLGIVVGHWGSTARAHLSMNM